MHIVFKLLILWTNQTSCHYKMSLFLVVILAFKCVLSAVDIAMPVFFWLLFSWCIFIFDLAISFVFRGDS